MSAFYDIFMIMSSQMVDSSPTLGVKLVISDPEDRQLGHYLTPSTRVLMI